MGELAVATVHTFGHISYWFHVHCNDRVVAVALGTSVVKRHLIMPIWYCYGDGCRPPKRRKLLLFG